jgi:RNA polymerase sigma factor
LTHLLHLLRKDPLTKRLEKIKKGDGEEREKIIEEYIPFIVKTVSNKMNRYIEAENSEEYSIGIEAFNEAIDRYESSKGNFISFSKLVIQSRITDHMRRSSRHKSIIPISQFDENDRYRIEDKLGTDDFMESFIMKDEIREFEARLKEFDITFLDLVKEAPKQMNTRKNGIRIARYIVSHREVKEEFFRKKALPRSILIEELQTTVKILKKSRKFIIATALILDSDLDLLKSYINGIEGGEETAL